jgi:glycosyltransferase involved in cell wall biosynthesis
MESPNNDRLQVSVIVPVVEMVDDLEALYREYSAELREMGRTFEFIFVLDGRFARLREPLAELKRRHPEVRIVVLGRSFGESAALTAGLSVARGESILTMASYFQVETRGVRELLSKLDDGFDIAVTRRQPRIDSVFNRLQSRVFHGIIRLMTGARYRDITCGFRAMRRNVLDEIQLYGDLHHFIPILAHQAGFKVAEVSVPQRQEEARTRVFGPGVYLSRLLDILTIFFLTRFARKPLRFFGSVGSAVFVVGFLISAYLAAYRLLGFGGIANRPLLLLGVLMVVFGVQSVSIGLVGEIVIFTHARTREYRIETIL